MFNGLTKISLPSSMSDWGSTLFGPKGTGKPNNLSKILSIVKKRKTPLAVGAGVIGTAGLGSLLSKRKKKMIDQ